jgi:hypothetical protein
MPSSAGPVVKTVAPSSPRRRARSDRRVCHLGWGTLRLVLSVDGRYAVRRRIITVAVTLSLVMAGAAGAVGVNHIVHVQSGDNIIVNTSLRCYVGSGDISCGGAAASRIGADIQSDGKILILVSPTPHGVYPLMSIQRAVCARPAGICYLVVGRS